MTDDVLDRFSPATRGWFTGSFAAPTAAQAAAWEAISSGQHTLVVAPTGSGKTLSAFLWALDRLVTQPPPEDALRRCRVLYVSPMKALAVDVQRNLRTPLVGIRREAGRLGLPDPQVSVTVRSGDTPAAQRRAFGRRPSDVLITTPESLFLLLTSAAREALRGVQTVILDEIHAVAGSKRGAHLAVSLERLDALADRPAQRIGLSATVRPAQEVARFLAGGRPVSVCQPVAKKSWDLRVVVPVPDMSDLSAGRPVEDGPAPTPTERASIWPHVEERIVDLVTAHRSTLIFANSRRLAERLTARLNEIWQQRIEADLDPGDEAPPARAAAAAGGAPAQLMGAAGASSGARPLLARAHHGSMSKQVRASIEDDLKAGRLRAVVATSSLELGIDMGAIDLVVQVESPPSAASGLQRVGRAGHQVGATSRGVIFPKFRADLVQATVVAQRMRAGQIEQLHVPANPLDVLAQHVVAMCAMDDWDVDDLHALVRRSAPFATVTRPVLESVLDMLSGRYPSDEFAELRPRVTWDRVAGRLTGRSGAQWLATTSGGTIPDRGLFAVMLAGQEGPGRRVGELDEEMVYESRVGDVITLGSSSWRIEEITHDQVLVSPAPGEPGRLPFWKGDTMGRPAELGVAIGQFVRHTAAQDPEQARAALTASGLDAWASDNLLAYLSGQRAATGSLPDDRTVLIERFRDQLGDWRVVVHSPFGAQVHAPWALVIAARLQERTGVPVQAMHADDGIVLRLADTDRSEGDLDRDVLEAVTCDPRTIEREVTDRLGGSALFASRFRECAARSLLLPRRQPGRRQALWQQRQRSASLLEVASRYPTFPVTLETVRECVQDVFDVPALRRLLDDVQARRVTVVSVRTDAPSPFASSLLFGYVAQFLYEGDSPLAERRAAALALDPSLLADLLGGAEGTSLADLLDQDVIERTGQELQRLAPGRQCTGRDQVADLLRTLGPLTTQQIEQRCDPGHRGDLPGWLRDLDAMRQTIVVRWSGQRRHAAVTDAATLRDGLGVALPPGIPEGLLEPADGALDSLVRRYARTHTPFGEQDLASALAIGPGVARDVLRRLVGAGRVVTGDLLPPERRGGRPGPDYCDAEVLRLLRRRSLAALRAQVEPVQQRALARFIPRRQHVGAPLRGEDGLVRVVEQLAGARLPASALESLILPARVADYTPDLLDRLMSAGEVLWQGRGRIAADDGWVSLHLADTAPLTLTAPEGPDTESAVHTMLRDRLAGGGAFRFADLAAAGRQPPSAPRELADALWDLVWAGAVTSDTLAGLRARLRGGHTAHRPRRAGPRRSRIGRLHSLAVQRPTSVATAGPSTVGRWSALPTPEPDVHHRMVALAEQLLDRYGVVTRGCVGAEEVPGGFAALYKVYAAAEEAGRLRRGYFVEGLGASQFGEVGAVDRLRDAERADEPGAAPDRPCPPTLLLAASDPANPFGAALPWPDRPGDSNGHRPARKSGSLVLVRDGILLAYLERGGRTVLTWTRDVDRLREVASTLADAVTRSVLDGLTVTTIDQEAVLGSDHPLVAALGDAGFHTTPRGLRKR